MWRKFSVFIFIVLFLAISGCSQISKPPASQAVTPTPPPPPKYTVGDIVKTKSGDNTALIIIDYDLKNRKYSVRTVIYDDFGRIYYIKEIKGQSVPFQTIESSYPIKAGNMDNPYGLSEISYPRPKFGIGSIHKEDDYKDEGIIILSYDYGTDKYTYAYVYYEGGGNWNYDPEATQSGSRVKIEDQYKE